MLDRIEPEAFDEVMNMVHNLNMVVEDKIIKKIKPEWIKKLSDIDSICQEYQYCPSKISDDLEYYLFYRFLHEFQSNSYNSINIFLKSASLEKQYKKNIHYEIKASFLSGLLTHWFSLQLLELFVWKF